jgi:hypothetical protein
MKHAIKAVLYLLLAVSFITIYSFLRTPGWIQGLWAVVLLALPDAGIVIALIELRHSGEANQLREERNRLAKENNDLTRKVHEIQEESNKRLAEIASNVQRPPTKAERNAVTLRKFLSRKAVVHEGTGHWGSAAEIADVLPDNIVALFVPSNYASQAWCAYVECDQIDIVERPQGAFALELTIHKRYGGAVMLGEITRWEDRKISQADATFDRGDLSYQVMFTKQASSETRTISIYASKDGANLFMMEVSTGERFVGTNKSVSIRALSQMVEFRSEGFTRGPLRTGTTPFPLFIE